MKKTMKKLMAFVLTLSIIFGCTMTAFAAEPDRVEGKVEVYNGAGQYIGTFDSFEEFQMEYLGANERSIVGAAKFVLKIILEALNTYSVFETCKELTGKDVNGWITENVTLPIGQGLGTFKLYSVSGGITNPYPPNSYQYSQYNKTNYYWVKQ